MSRLYDHLSSRELLGRARQGDRRAMSALIVRHVPFLQRWAHGRLPRWARSLADTGDLVQDAILKTFRRLDRFEPRAEHALRVYLRRAIQNRIRDELRRHDVRGTALELDGQEQDRSPSPLALSISSEQMARYRGALCRLREEERALIVGRFELGYNYEQLALATGRVSPDAARVALRRAMRRLAEEMAGG
jgi:RNA polymerase sigma-70 factor (ECF subfamily)